MLDHITPVILTFNEQENIQRTLNALRWAKRILVVDSFSNDQTEEDYHLQVINRVYPVSYTHLTLPTTPYV